MHRPPSSLLPKAQRPRAGRGNPLWVLLSGAVAIIVLCVALLSRGPSVNRVGDQQLTMYTAAGMRIAVEKIVDQYEQEFGKTALSLQTGCI